MAKVIPFPASRRVRLIANGADEMLRRDRAKADAWLAKRLQTHAQMLARKGVFKHEIEADLTRYEVAVRAAMWRVVSGTGGAA
jgi:hypothetical protein